MKKGKRREERDFSAFNKHMGLSVCGFEEKVVERMKRMGGEVSTKVEGEETSSRPRQTTKFDRELKKLEWSLSYKKRKDKKVEASRGENLMAVK